MKYLLSKASLPIVERLAKDRTLCAFDFDGTLAPIVDHPHLARMRGPTRRLLKRVASLYPCIVVSGRNREDVVRRMHGVPLAGIFGNHGAEADGKEHEDRRIKHWKAALEAEIGGLPGVWVEDKGTSLAVHYRQSLRPAQSVRRITEAVAKLNEVRTFGGKKVVNLVVDGAPTKADAVVAERDRLRCNRVLYLGDDENDEDAFGMKGDVVAVRIGRKKHTRASYFLRSQMEIDQLLLWMARLRRAEPSE